jgi:hypothetical protein
VILRTTSHRLTRRAFLKIAVTTSAALLLPGLARCVQEPSMGSPNVVPRDQWGAVEPDVEGSVEGVYDPVANPGGWLVYDEPLPQVLTTIVVHHSALPLSDGPLEIQRKHMQSKGFADIGYNFVVDETGQICEGRSLNVRGAHTGGHNTGTVGIVLLGNFEWMEPAEAQLAALKALVKSLADEYAITHVAGHRDFQPGVTKCPGRNLEARLPGLARELALEFGTQGYAQEQAAPP